MMHQRAGMTRRALVPSTTVHEALSCVVGGTMVGRSSRSPVMTLTSSKTTPETRLALNGSPTGTLLRTTRRPFFNIGWPFAEEGGKAIKYHDVRVLPYSAEEVFDVVADVDKYQEFLPWCTHSRVLFKTQSRMDAELGVGFKMLPGQSYVSQITLKRPHSIKVSVPESSLFHHLTNDWTLQDLSSDGKKVCRATFDISFELRSALHKKMADSYFQEVAENMIQVFSDRCAHVYRNNR